MTNKVVAYTIVGALLLGSLPACNSDRNDQSAEVEGTGDLRFPLETTAVSGNVYRLRSAQFQIVGPESTLVSPPDDASTSFTTELDAGLYSIELLSGWQLWRMGPTEQLVDAALVSPNPIVASVQADTETAVTFQFHAGSDVVVFGPGELTVDIAVDEMTAGVCGDGVVQPGEQCDDDNTVSGDGCSSACALESLCGNGVIEPGEACDDGNGVDGDGCSASCADELVLPELSALSPASGSVLPGGTVEFTITLDSPAPAGGTVVGLTASSGTLPPTVTIPQGQQSVTFSYTHDGSSPFVTVVASLGESSLYATLTLVQMPTNLVINEVDYDQVGPDTDEFVEIYNGSADPVSLANVALVFINGLTALEYGRVNLAAAGPVLGSGQYLVVGTSTLVALVNPGALRVAFPLASNNLQNGAPDGLVLVDLSAGVIIDTLAYEGAMPPATITGLASGLLLGDSPQAADDNVITKSLARFPNGNDTDSGTDWMASVMPSPGLPN